MSIVYEGVDERLKRPVAIKILHPFLAESSSSRSRFFREAQAVARLAHENIVQIFDVSSPEVANEELYIVTELLIGETLKEFSKRLNLVEMPELSAMIIREIGHALDHAHHHGVIHRDIKPENIMITKSGHIKLMDFGIASVGSEESITQAGVLLGSLAHLSPEAIKGQKATVASDVFSLATVLFWMLSNELPFSGDSPHALLKSIVDEPSKQIRELSPYVSDDLAEVVEKGMEKEPRNRFKKAYEMCEAIEHALSKMGISVDTKQIQWVLKDPEGRASHFKNLIAEQIKKQRELYGQAKNEALVLALTCRLEAPSAGRWVKQRGSWPKKTVFNYLGLLAACAFLLLLAMMLLPKKDDKKESMPIVHEVSQSQTHVVDASDASILTSEETRQNNQTNAEEPPPIWPKQKEENKTQTVNIIVWPFATINVDGKIIAKDKKIVQLKLKEGTHTLTFTHTYAATVEKIITINKMEKPLEMYVALNKSKPAFLVIKSELDSDVAIDGRYKGTSKKSENFPIVIPMPDKSHHQMKEVIVSRDNFEPLIIKTEFIAGQTKEIEATLKPLQKSEAKP